MAHYACTFKIPFTLSLSVLIHFQHSRMIVKAIVYSSKHIMAILGCFRGILLSRANNDKHSKAFLWSPIVGLCMCKNWSVKVRIYTKETSPYFTTSH